MNTNFDGKLEYRDYVVHVFTGILLNVFLLAALFPTLPDRWWEYDLHNEIIVSLIAIPILFLEGHFILVIDRLLFIEIPSWFFLIKNKKSVSVSGQPNKSPFRNARKNLYEKHPSLFIILFGKRIIGQKVIQKTKHPDYVKTTDEEKLSVLHRYYILSDFFKGVGCAAWIALIVALTQQNWIVIVIMAVVIVLSWFRTRFYSSRYAKQYYVKKSDAKQTPAQPEHPNTSNDLN